MRQQLARFVCVFALLVCCALPAASAQEPFSPPPQMPTISENGQDIRNYILLGSDNSSEINIGRTDVLVIVSVNLDAATVAMLSLPRDLYLHIPDHGLGKINTVYALGHSSSDTTGFELLQATVLYNLGITLDGFARVNFDGFREIIDALGGIEIAVDCAIQDWQLLSPELDVQNEANWELVTLPIGMHVLDGQTTLWYLRSRRTSSDFDRGRRHQIVLRAIVRRVQDAGLLFQLPQLYPQLLELVDTDISLEEVLTIAQAVSLTPEHIATYRFEQNMDVSPGQAPDGSHIQVPVYERTRALLEQFLTPPTSLQVGREQPSVEIVNASGIERLDEVAAERLRWEGFTVRLGTPAGYQFATNLTDMTGNSKGASRDLLQGILRVDSEYVIIMPQPTRAADFRVMIGGSYYACTHNVVPPSDPTPGR